MLVEFSIKNFRSFKDKTTFSMQTAPYLKKHKDTNTFQFPSMNLLKNAVIFGPNGSGKSNVFEGMATLRDLITNFAAPKGRGIPKLPHQPFKMHDSNENSDTEFEVILHLDKILYQYIVSFNENQINYESLSILKKSKDECLFIREYDQEEDTYHYWLSSKVNDFRNLTRKNILYLSILNQFNDTHAINIVNWFLEDLQIVRTNYELKHYGHLLDRLAEDKNLKDNVVRLLRVADYNIIDLELKEKRQKIPGFIKEYFEYDDEEEFIEYTDVFTVYNRFDSNGELLGATSLHADSFESRGTKKMIIIAVILLDALQRGKTLLMEEFDSAFHLAISKFLMKLFNTKLYNKSSQFILNTHEVSLLDNDILRVDQIWFVEKDKDNNSDLYSLYDFNDANDRPRSDITYANDYLKGKFGAYPVINNHVFDYNFLHRSEDE
ncbi:ATP-binding protein [Virgibacillus siamensis]|uniref:ATP-binding protein n=1 Tax=Virgibacillus siamensis TaxID=480071 RepID=A0ABN1GEC3_9BACI